MGKDKAKDEGQYVLDRLYRVIDNPMDGAEDRETNKNFKPTPYWYENPIDEVEAAAQSRELGVTVKPRPGRPWTLMRTILYVFMVQGNIDDVDDMRQARRLRKRMEECEGNKIVLVHAEIKFLRDLAEKLAKAKKMLLPCWDALDEALTEAEATPYVAPTPEPVATGAREG